MTHVHVKSLIPGEKACQHRGPVCGREDEGEHAEVDWQALVYRLVRAGEFKRDHACRQCVPHVVAGPGIPVGWLCAMHAAVDAIWEWGDYPSPADMPGMEEVQR